MTMEDKLKPVHKVRFGNIQIAMWENRSQEGNVFHTLDLERSYVDKDGVWQSQRISLNVNEVRKASAALDKAFTDYYTLPALRRDQNTPSEQSKTVQQAA